MPEATMAPPVVGTAPPGQSPYAYDVFMSYCPEDRGWVWDELQPRLEMAGLKCLDERDFEAGVPVLENIERALDSCCRTLVVLTPAWVENQWNHFESLLVAGELVLVQHAGHDLMDRIERRPHGLAGIQPIEPLGRERA